jgi:hypothetical protein
MEVEKSFMLNVEKKLIHEFYNPGYINIKINYIDERYLINFLA